MTRDDRVEGTAFERDSGQVRDNLWRQRQPDFGDAILNDDSQDDTKTASIFFFMYLASNYFCN